MVRVRIEVDMPREGEPENFGRPKVRENVGVPRQWPPSSASPRSQTLSPQTSPRDHVTHTAFPSQQNAARQPRGGPVTVTTQPVFPIISQGTPQTPFTPHMHSPPDVPHATFAMRTSPQERHHLEPEELRDDPDEAWRRPMPHNQRRRAGKHTKRVVVK